jgi:hypothetical protein
MIRGVEQGLEGDEDWQTLNTTSRDVTTNQATRMTGEAAWRRNIYTNTGSVRVILIPAGINEECIGWEVTIRQMTQHNSNK